MTTLTKKAAPATRPGYAIGYLTDVELTEGLLAYMAAVEETMARFGGRWLVHGTTPDVLEGRAGGDVVIIEFPDPEHARSWYESAEYQEIIELRTASATAWIALLEGVPAGYSTHSTIAALRATLG